MNRTDPDHCAGESATLTQFLDYYRATLLGQADGLTTEQLRIALAPSPLTLGGLLKHLAYVEDSWFQFYFRGLDRAAVEPWNGVDWSADEDWDFHSAADDDAGYLRELYTAACERSREVVAATPDLDRLSTSQGEDGDRRSLRWILVHMLEETARHCGHADLIRESIDGVTDD